MCGVVNHLSADNGQSDARLQDLILGNRSQDGSERSARTTGVDRVRLVSQRGKQGGQHRHRRRAQWRDGDPRAAHAAGLEHMEAVARLEREGTEAMAACLSGAPASALC